MTLVLFFKPTPSWFFFSKKKITSLRPTLCFYSHSHRYFVSKKLVGIGVGHIRDRGCLNTPGRGEWGKSEGFILTKPPGRIGVDHIRGQGPIHFLCLKKTPRGCLRTKPPLPTLLKKHLTLCVCAPPHPPCFLNPNPSTGFAPPHPGFFSKKNPHPVFFFENNSHPAQVWPLAPPLGWRRQILKKKNSCSKTIYKETPYKFISENSS